MTYTVDGVRVALPMIWWGLCDSETPRLDADTIRGTSDPRRVNAWQDIKIDMERAYRESGIDIIDQQMLWYAFACDFTQTYIAAMYGITPATVSKRISAALATITDYLNGNAL